MSAKQEIPGYAFPLRTVLDAALGGTPGDWRVDVAAPWCHVRHREEPRRIQGWKLHVSATPLSAPLVLFTAAQVLARHRCSFKFAATLRIVADMVGASVDRGSGGKFVTAYPHDDEHFRLLVRELHEATRGFPGPAILSDRPYCPRSLVHYRYGAFYGVNHLTDDGSYERMLTDPEGALVSDQRKAWFTPPPWAGNPFGDEPLVPRQKPSGVLLNGRYEVRRAVRHANKGGVFLGHDRLTGDDVVVKQGRPHTRATLAGTDSRTALRHEADMLRRLGACGATPQFVDLFEQGDDLFLVEERISGMPLRQWSEEHAAELSTEAHTRNALRIARGMTDLLRTVHGAGLVVTDLSPNNVLLTDALEVRMVDLEYVVEDGAPLPGVYTPGYGAPEAQRDGRGERVSRPAADLYSLGALLFLLATGCHPVLAPDDPPGRTMHERLAALVDVMWDESPALRAVAPVVLGLTEDDPRQRWGLARVAAALDEAREAPVPDADEAGAPARLRAAIPSPEAAAADGLRYLTRLIDTANPREVAPSGSFGARTDRCSVQHGAAGLLAVLNRAVEAGAAQVTRADVAALAGWIGEQLPREPRTLPGLYFGRAGTAWALCDAGLLLSDPQLTGTAVALAERLPLRWANPDVCHGAAGAGLALLHLWHVLGDEAMLGRAAVVADGLLAAADRVGDEVWWPVPPSSPSALAGIVHLGFGHGAAGVATFLLQAAEATGNRQYLDTALAAGRTLLGRVIHDGSAAWWPADRNDEQAERQMMTPHWCTGASGIGTFLVRLWSATGDERFLRTAEAAAETAWRARWQAGAVQCHGAAGDGELALDLYAATGDAAHRRRAEDFATAMLARATVRDGLVVLTDESMLQVTADYQTGLAGAVAFLLRLCGGGPRLFMADRLSSHHVAGRAPALTVAP